jgi:hypothetical protein
MSLCVCVNLALQNKSFRGQPLLILSEKEVHHCVTHFIVQCEQCGKQFNVSSKKILVLSIEKRFNLLNIRELS